MPHNKLNYMEPQCYKMSHNKYSTFKQYYIHCMTLLCSHKFGLENFWYKNLSNCDTHSEELLSLIHFTFKHLQ